MLTRIRRISILQSGLMFAIMYAVFGIIYLPLFLIGNEAIRNPLFGVGVLFGLILFPIIGFIGGILMAIIYNLAARLIGGMEMEVVEAPYANYPPSNPQHMQAASPIQTPQHAQTPVESVSQGSWRGS